MNENNVPAAAALSCACVDPMCACRGGPCTECPEGQAIAAAPVAQPPATAEANLRNKVADLFKIGADVRNDATIIANVTNALHLVDCLMAVERELFTTMVPDEDGEDGDEIEDCCVNSWGSEPAQYVEQVRAAIAALATQPPAPVQQTEAVAREHSPEFRRLYWSINNLMCHIGFEGEINARHGFVEETMDALHAIDGGTYSAHITPLREPIGEVVIGPAGDVEGWTVVKWTEAGCPPVGTKLYIVSQPFPAPALPPVAREEPDCWAICTPNGSKLVSPEEAKGRKDAYPLYAAPQQVEKPARVAMSDERILELATHMFPRWREDIQERFVLLLAHAVLGASTGEQSHG